MKRIIIVVTVLSGLFVAQCSKNDTLTIKPSKAAITRAVSFKGDLVPLFAKNCAVAGCHDSRTPVLTAAQAYNSLINGSFVNTKTPASSIIYERLTVKLTPGMPYNAPGSDPGQINELVLAWITQGAKNN